MVRNADLGSTSNAQQPLFPLLRIDKDAVPHELRKIYEDQKIPPPAKTTQQKRPGS